MKLLDDAQLQINEADLQRALAELPGDLPDGAVCVGCGYTDPAGVTTLDRTRGWLARNTAHTLGVCTGCEHVLGVWQILTERARQIDEEGFSLERDDAYGDESMSLVAACYAAPSAIFRLEHTERDGFISAGTVKAWPESWPAHWDKRGRHSRRRQLEIAGALIAAELDRLRRAGLGDEP